MAPSIPNCPYHEVPWHISFSGSGFLALYQLGVALCFLKNAPWILRSAPCILGASAGSLIAAAVVCDMNLISIRDEMLLFAKRLIAITFGPLNPSVNVLGWLESLLHKYLPSDAHRQASSRLGIAMTRLTDGKHVIMSEFQSKDEVVQALLCSCFVPAYCGFLPPTFRGVHYIDGGLSGIQPRLPDSSSRTLTVCPYSGDTDICPADPPCMFEMVLDESVLKFNVNNSFRILNSLYPIALETLEQAFQNGYKDGMNFLQTKNLVPSVLLHKVLQESPNYDQSGLWRHLEMTKDEEEEMKVEKENMAKTSFTNHRAMRMVSSTEPKSTGDYVLHFDMVKEVLLGNATTYLSMFGLPVRILSNLFLPLMVSFYALLQSKQRMKLLLRQFPAIVVWTWHGLRNCTIFFFNIIVCTFKKYIKDRVMHVILLLRWLKVEIPHEVL